jgi:hypothetical protein
MSMAVYDDADRMDDGEQAAAQGPEKNLFRDLWALFLELLSCFGNQIRLKARRARRRVLIRIRKVFAIDEDTIRDQIIEGLERDREALAMALAQTVTGLNALNSRLEYHEEHIPRMRTLKAKFDEEKKKKIEEHVQGVEDQLAAQRAKSERLKDGILTE